MMISWRFVDTGPCDAAMNMAIDESIASAVIHGETHPTLRLYSWEKPSVSIGCFQKLSDIDTVFCERTGIPVVRRPTGGRAILHGEEITYSFSGRNEDHPAFRTLLGSYEMLSRAFYAAFRKLGLEVSIRRRKERGKILARNPRCFESVSFGEMVLHDIKIIGSAQKRYQGGFLQQGSIPFFIDRHIHDGIFGPSDHFHGGLQDLAPGITMTIMRKTIQEVFAEVFSRVMEKRDLTPEEVQAAREIQGTKYQSQEWTGFR
jgi:lipoate-protein ligase A